MQANTHTNKINTNASFRGKEILLELYWCNDLNDSGVPSYPLYPHSGLILLNTWSLAGRTAFKDQEAWPCLRRCVMGCRFEISKSCRFPVFSLSLPCGCVSRCEFSPVPSLCYYGLKPSKTIGQIKNFLGHGVLSQ